MGVCDQLREHRSAITGTTDREASAAGNSQNLSLLVQKKQGVRQVYRPVQARQTIQSKHSSCLSLSLFVASINLSLFFMLCSTTWLNHCYRMRSKPHKRAATTRSSKSCSSSSSRTRRRSTSLSLYTPATNCCDLTWCWSCHGDTVCSHSRCPTSSS